MSLGTTDLKWGASSAVKAMDARGLEGFDRLAMYAWAREHFQGNIAMGFEVMAHAVAAGLVVHYPAAHGGVEGWAPA